MNTTRLIEAFLDGSLEKDKVEEIKARAKNDAEFADLIRLHKEINESIRDNELHNLRQILRKISVEKDTSMYLISFPFRRIIKITAVFLFILIVGAAAAKWIFAGYSRSAIFEKYYFKYEPDVITRSGDLSKNGMENAQFLYQTGNYTECAEMLDELVRNDKQNFLALFYLGLAKIELQKTNEAIINFLKIPPNWNSPYSIHRNWYLALCLIKTGQERQALPLLKRLSIEDEFYSGRAKKIMSKIRI
jgi:tetratricopeptide (TPR) repeat protein